MQRASCRPNGSCARRSAAAALDHGDNCRRHTPGWVGCSHHADGLPAPYCGGLVPRCTQHRQPSAAAACGRSGGARRATPMSLAAHLHTSGSSARRWRSGGLCGTRGAPHARLYCPQVCVCGGRQAGERAGAPLGLHQPVQQGWVQDRPGCECTSPAARPSASLRIAAAGLTFTNNISIMALFNCCCCLAGDKVYLAHCLSDPRTPSTAVGSSSAATQWSPARDEQRCARWLLAVTRLLRWLIASWLRSWLRGIWGGWVCTLTLRNAEACCAHKAGVASSLLASLWLVHPPPCSYAKEYFLRLEHESSAMLQGRYVPLLQFKGAPVAPDTLCCKGQAPLLLALQPPAEDASL